MSLDVLDDGGARLGFVLAAGVLLVPLCGRLRLTTARLLSGVLNFGSGGWRGANPVGTIGIGGRNDRLILSSHIIG